MLKSELIYFKRDIETAWYTLFSDILQSYSLKYLDVWEGVGILIFILVIGKIVRLISAVKGTALVENAITIDWTPVRRFVVWLAQVQVQQT